MHPTTSHEWQCSSRSCRHDTKLSASNTVGFLHTGAAHGRDYRLRTVSQYKPPGHSSRGIQGVVRTNSPRQSPPLAWLTSSTLSRESRRRLKQFLTVVRPRSSHVQKVLSLLIESGALYSALWVSLLRREARTYLIYAHKLLSTECV